MGALVRIAVGAVVVAVVDEVAKKVKRKVST